MTDATPHTDNPLPDGAPDAAAAPTAAAPYTGPERRSSLRVWQDKVDRRLKDGDARMQALATDLAENTKATAAIKADTAELVDLLHSVKGAFRVLDLLARMARPLGFLAAAGASFYGLFVAIKGGGGGPKL